MGPSASRWVLPLTCVAAEGCRVQAGMVEGDTERGLGFRGNRAAWGEGVIYGTRQSRNHLYDPCHNAKYATKVWLWLVGSWRMGL